MQLHHLQYELSTCEPGPVSLTHEIETYFLNQLERGKWKKCFFLTRIKNNRFLLHNGTGKPAILDTRVQLPQHVMG